MVLRPVSGGHEVVGECYVHGLENANAFLGPLPAPWRVVAIAIISSNVPEFRFYNPETSTYTMNDPRLPSLSEWERIDHDEYDCNDPQIYDYFRHKETGEIMNSDPRMLPERLKDRGVDLITFSLV
jgi:hypothetical protein